MPRMPHARTPAWLAAVAVLVGTILAPPTVARAAEPPVVQEQLIRDAVHRITLGQFWGAVVVRVDGQDVFRQGFGFEDASLIPIDPGASLFDVGSIAKSFTAATILKLTESGDLTLTTTLHEVFPNDDLGIFDDTTLEELLTHRWGVIYPKDTGKVDYTHLDAIPFILARTERTHDRGLYAYSNFGYFVLAAVIEHRTGEPFETAVWERVIKPAGLKHTGFVGDTSIEGARPTARIASQGRRTDTFNYPWNWAQRGATGVVTTADDAAHWIEAVVQGDLLQPASLQDMLTPRDFGYALGWRIESNPDGSPRRIGHGGGTSGYRSTLGHYPAEEHEGTRRPAFTISVLTNERYDPETIEQAIARLLAPPLPEPTKADLYLINYPSRGGVIERSGKLVWEVLPDYQGRATTGEAIIDNRPTIILNDHGASVWATLTRMDHADARDLAAELEAAAEQAALLALSDIDFTIRINATPYTLDDYRHASLPDGSRWVITTDAGAVVATLTDAETGHPALTARMPAATARDLAGSLRQAAD